MINKSVVVYEGDNLLGEVEVYYLQNQNGVVLDDIRISHFSPPSERCPPLAVLHTINSTGVCFKLESKSNSQINLLHSTCLTENKTAVMYLGCGEELHLVAMLSRKNDRQGPFFWGFSVPSGLYNSCLVMLNLRCLGIVFDLDETLIVANTLRSFEDRIEALQRKINSDSDPQRVSSMLAEVKRYQDDKIILKQYAENDQIVENGKVIKSLPEVVPALSDNHQSLIRPLIRLQEKNIILTRINPMIRDTSVLVRLRPAWEDLRSYLIARDRKRFEVYVCTMAERDYALEMWRLLDPESKLINTKEFLNRIVCVKSGLKKSLLNVFQDGNCDPKMAMVIDDRLKVWDEKDQPRVHVVPAFAPYYAPQAEANNAIPVLCVARNVACNVRGGFFKDFDDGLLQRISDVKYEDDVKDSPLPHDVSDYLVSEDDASALNGNKDSFSFNGMADIEVESRLKDATSASSTVPSVVTSVDLRLVPPPSISNPVPTMQGQVMSFPSQPVPPQVTTTVKHLNQVGLLEKILQNSPAREEGEVPESELDPDTRRRLLILQHGQDIRDNSPPSEPQFPIIPPRIEGRGSWFPPEEEMSPRQLNPGIPPEEFPLPSDRIYLESQKMPKEALQREDRLRSPLSLPPDRPPRLPKPIGYTSFSGEEVSLGRSSSGNKDLLGMEPGLVDTFAETPIGVLQDIAFKCGTKVEFRPAFVPSKELQFCVEVWFAEEKIGEAIGRTRRTAQQQAAEGSLMNLADKYILRLNPDSSSMHGYGNRFLNPNENSFVSDVNSFGYPPFPKEESLAFSNAPEPSMLAHFSHKRQGSPRSLQAISSKRLKPEFPRVLQRMPSSSRYPRNASPVP